MTGEPIEPPVIGTTIESRRMFPGLLALALFLTGGSALLWLRGSVFRSMGTLGLIVFGVWSVFLWIRWRRRLVLRMNEEGVEVLTTTRGPIPWSEIKNIRVGEEGNTLVIERQKTPQALPNSEAAPLMIGLEDVSTRAFEFMTYLSEHHPEKVPPPGPGLEVWIFSTDPLTAETGWELVEWCLSHGGEEFAVQEVERKPTPRVQAFFDRLRPHALPPARRPILSHNPIEGPIELWRLDRETIQILREFFNYGILANKSDDDFWMEDFAIYREGHVLMAVVNHEHEAYVNVLPREMDELRPMLHRPIHTPWIPA